jgi:large subunit ribosomal protein L19
MNMLEKIQRENLKANLPDFRPGDTIRVHAKIKEGDKERIQVFEGVVIRRKGHGVEATFTVRKVSYGVGVERIFPVHSPLIDKVEIAARGRVRRAKLYYLRDLSGKKARLEGEEGFQAAGASPEGPTAA